MKKLLAALLVAASITAAYAQSTKLTLDAEINTNFPDNTSGAITPAILRTTVHDIVASYVDWLVCTAQGGIVYWNSTATPTCLTAGTSGQFLKTQGPGANPVWATPALPASALTLASNNVVVGNKNGTNQLAQELTVTGVLDIVGSTNGQVLNRAAGAWAGTAIPTLGASGTLGSVTMGNATSGLLTIQPAAGALGASTLSAPAATDTLVGKATTDIFTNKTYDTAGTGNSLSINGVAATANTGTGSVVRSASPTFTGTPVLATPTATSLALGGCTISTNALCATGTAAVSSTITSGANGGTGGKITFNGSTSGAQSFTVAAAAGALSALQLPTTNGNSGDVLSTNAAGVLSWAAAAGGGTVTSVATDGSMYGGPIIGAGTLGVAVPTMPQGRLTLTTLTPVLVATVSGATTVYYTPYQGAFVPLYDGTRFVQTTFTEVSQTTADTTKSPAAVAASSCYDMFAWTDAGTFRVTRGPVWTNTTTRSAGTALVLTNGTNLNNASITNGPAASRGTYVGTICSNAGSTIDFIFGASSAGGTAAILNVWNAYNQVAVPTIVQDSTASWAYRTTTWRSADNSNTNRVTFVQGLNQQASECMYVAQTDEWQLVGGSFGCGLDSTSAAPLGAVGHSRVQNSAAGRYVGFVGIGQHYFQAMEYGSADSSGNWLGAPTTAATMGLSAIIRM